MNKDDLIKLAKSVANTFNLPSDLVCAIVEQESNWNVSLVRFEPLFMKRYETNLTMTDDEKADRSTSWGLMQLMGETAREIGFTQVFEQLLTPEIGLSWGCRFFETRVAHAYGNMTKALLLWNGGSNTEYPDQVFARVPKYQDALSA